MSQCALCDSEAQLYYRIGDIVLCRNHYLLACAVLTRWVSMKKQQRAEPRPDKRARLQRDFEQSLKD